MARYLGGVTVSGYIAPSDTADIYATHRASLGMGGYRSALDLAARDAITDPRREEGMIVYVISEGKEYRLKNGITNTHWVEIINTSSGISDTNYVIFNDLTERDLFPLAGRKIGLIGYVISEDKEYRLIAGVDNSNWVEIVSTGTGSGTGCCNYVIVDSLEEVENYPISDRFIGLTIYAKDVDREFRFVGGTDNSNLKEINSILVDYNGNPSSGGSGNSTNTITINNNYYNTFGCLNKALIAQTLADAGANLIPVYVDSNGNEIISGSDINEFKFKINSSDFWVEDWVFFEGSTFIESGKTPEVFIELTQNGNTEVLNIFQIMAGNSSPASDFVITGTQSRWRGYLKRPTQGRLDIKAYQTQDGIQMALNNKTIYFFVPNFAILDGTSPTPGNILNANTLALPKEYSVRVISNTNLVINLARVQTTAYGIDKNNYTVIPGTTQIFTANQNYQIPTSILNTLVSGKYALVVNGSDAGVTIPTYFYGPFSVSSTIASSPTGTTPISTIPATIAAVLAMPTTATSSGSPVTTASGTSLINPTPSNSVIIAQFLSILNAIFGPSNQAVIAAEIAATDLSGLTSSNINTYVNQIYTNLTT